MKEEKEKPGRQGILPFSSIRTTMLTVFSRIWMKFVLMSIKMVK